MTYACDTYTRDTHVTHMSHTGVTHTHDTHACDTHTTHILLTRTTHAHTCETHDTYTCDTHARHTHACHTCDTHVARTRHTHVTQTHGKHTSDTWHTHTCDWHVLSYLESLWVHRGYHCCSLWPCEWCWVSLRYSISGRLWHSCLDMMLCSLALSASLTYFACLRSYKMVLSHTCDILCHSYFFLPT